MRNFLEHHRYELVMFSALTAGTILVHKLSHEVADLVWKKTLPLFDAIEMSIEN